MAKSDQGFLVCLPVGTSCTVVPGSMRKTCSDCGHSVWVSPASWQLSQERELPILCVPCAEARAAKDDDVQVHPPTAEQCKEVAEAIRKEIIEGN